MNYNVLKINDGTEILAGTMYGIGQNFAKHAIEMGSSIPENPTVFIKPPSALIVNGQNVILPDFSENVHHEVELVVLISEDCYKVEESDVYKYIAGYAVGIDVTLRDIQTQAKKEGRPWSVAKGFYTSAPISDFISQKDFGNEIPYFDLKLYVNGDLKQSGSTRDMERSVQQLVKYLAGVFTLRKGDLIFTGTPEGVGKINKGDKIRAELTRFTELNVGVE